MLQLLAVVVQVLVQVLVQPVFEAPHRRPQPGRPVSQQGRRGAGLAEDQELLLQELAGHDVKAVPGQGSAEGAFVAGAGEHT